MGEGGWEKVDHSVERVYDPQRCLEWTVERDTGRDLLEKRAEQLCEARELGEVRALHM